MLMRLISKLLRHAMPVAVVCAMAACKPGVPSELIQPDEMEDILYDYHVADGMAVAEGNYTDVAFRRLAYREAVLRKHQVTEAQLDTSLIYYYRHADQLHEIYSNLAKRLDADAVALGASANELSQFGSITSQGDTATVWNYRQTAVLMPQAPYNTISFDVKADTAYHEGDKMILSFDTRFIYQDGSRNGTAYLAVCFKNDSTATQIVHMGGDMHYNLQVTDEKRLGIKAVRGFIHLGRDKSNSPSLKMLSISNMKLMRMHTEPPKEADDDGQQPGGLLAPRDTTATASIPVQGNPNASVSLRPQVHNADVPSHAPPTSAPPPATAPSAPHAR